MRTRHDGDCYIYGKNGICTCGLLHQVMAYPGTPDYEKFSDELGKHLHNLDWLMDQKVPEPKKLTEEEMQEARNLLKKLFDKPGETA